MKQISPLIQYIRDSKTHTIPLELDDVDFVPGNDYVLMFTLKKSPKDPDSAALVQKVTGAGITHSGSNALVAFVPDDTTSKVPNSNLFWDVRSQHLITGARHTVCVGKMNLKQDIGRNTTTSVPVITTEPPLQITVPPVILRTASEGPPTPNFAETSFPYDTDNDLRFEQIDNGDPPTIEFVGVELGADLVTVSGRAITVQFGTNFGAANTFPSEVITWISEHPEASTMIVAMLKPGQTGTGAITQPAFGPVTLSGSTPVPSAIGQMCRVGDAAPYQWFRAESVTPVVWVEMFTVAAPAEGDMIQRVGGSWVPRTIAQVKTALGMVSSSTVNISAATYTLSSTDNGKELVFSNAAGCDVTIPSALGAGFNFSGYATGGIVSILPDYPVTVNGTLGKEIRFSQGYDKINSFALAEDSFALSGSMVSGPANLLKYDSFVVTATRGLDGYVGGMSWFLHPLYTGDTGVISQTREGITESSDSTTKIYLSDASPASANYSVVASVTCSAGLGATGLLGRFNPTVLSGYMGRFSPTNNYWEIYRFDAGTGTKLAEVAGTLPPARSEISLVLNGSTISVCLNGVTKLSTTDATYSSARKSGLRIVVGTCTIHDFLIREFTEASALQLPSATIESLGWDETASTWIRSQTTGSQLRFKFRGTELALKMSNAAGVTGYLLVSIDGGAWARYQLKTGTYWSPIYYNPATSGTHSVCVVLAGNDSTVDNWTTPSNGCVITNIHVSSGGSLEAPSERTKKIAFIGDSITRGRGLTTTYYFGDATSGWAYIIGDKLRAKTVFQGMSGQGFVNAGSGNVPKASDAIPLYASGRTRAVDSTITHCFVAHGTNDATGNLASGAALTWAAARTRYPNAKIYVVLPLGYAANSASPSALSVRNSNNAIISSAFATWADGNSQLIDLTGKVYGNSMTGPLAGGSNAYTSDLLHPNAATNLLIAEDILSLIDV